MVLHKLHGLHEHAAGTAAGVVNLTLVRLNHLGNQVYDTLGGIELALALTFSQRKLAQKILIDPANNVLLFVLDGVDIVDGVDQGSQLADIQVKTGEIVVRQRALEGLVVFLHREKGGVNLDGNIILLGVFLDVAPAGFLRQVEDILHGVKLHNVDVFLFAFVNQLLPTLFKLVTGKFEKNQT